MPYNVKIIPTLPSEIQQYILQYLSLHECWHMAGVCKSWRLMVFSWESFWHTLSTKRNRFIVPDMLPYKRFITRGMVKHVSLRHGSGDEANLKNAIRFIQNQELYAISQVYINTYWFTKKDFIRLTDTCGPALTEVTLVGLVEGNPNTVRPDTILKRCPNLKKLHFKGALFDPGWVVGLLGVKHQALNDLLCQLDDIDFNARLFLEAVPKLQRLCLVVDNITSMDSQVFPDLIHQYCPELKTFVLRQRIRYEAERLNDSCYGRVEDGDDRFPTVVGEEMIKGNKYHNRDATFNKAAKSPPLRKKQEARGLQHIVFHDNVFHSDVSSNILLPLILEASNNHQLVSLDLAGSGSVNDDVLMRISELTLPSLKYLALKGTSPWDVTNVAGLRSIFDQSNRGGTSLPNITYIAFRHLDAVVDTVLDDIASSCPHLQHVLFDNCQGITTTGMTQFLERLARQLRIITIEQSGFALTPRVLHVIATKLEFLEQLTIEAFQYDFLALADVEAFLDVRRRRLLEEEGKEEKANDKEKKVKIMKKLDIHFVFDSSLDYPGKARVDRFLRKLNSCAKEWRFSMAMSDEEIQLVRDCGDDVYEEITHVEYRRNESEKRVK